MEMSEPRIGIFYKTRDDMIVMCIGSDLIDSLAYNGFVYTFVVVKANVKNTYKVGYQYDVRFCSGHKKYRERLTEIKVEISEME